MTMGVLIEKEGIESRSSRNGNSNGEGQINPSPHFSDLLFDRMAVDLVEFFLVLNTSSNLSNRFCLHGFCGPSLRDHNCRATLGNVDRRTTGNWKSGTKRLRQRVLARASNVHWYHTAVLRSLTHLWQFLDHALHLKTDRVHTNTQEHLERDSLCC